MPARARRKQWWALSTELFIALAVYFTMPIPISVGWVSFIMVETIQQYLNWKATHTQRAPSAYKRLLQLFHRIINKPIESASVDDVIKFKQILEIKYSPAYVAFAMVVIKGYLYKMERWGKAKIDADDIRIPRFVKKRKAYVIREDMDAMVAQCNEWEFTGLTKKLVLELLWSTGIRVSELCSLEVEQIDTRKDYTVITTRKGYREDTIQWSKEAHRLLIKYLGVRICLNQQPPLLISYSRRTRLTPRTVERWIEELRKAAKIQKHITPHSFRHGKAHNMLLNGATVKDIQAVLRHSEDNPQASFQYIRLDETEFLRIARKYQNN